MTLKWNLATKGMRPHGQLRQKLQQKIGKLENHLEHFPPDAVYLQVNLERHPRKLWFVTSLTLRLPSNILRAQKSGADPVPAFDQAVKALLRELAVLKSALRHENTWKRAAHGEMAPEAKTPRVATLPPLAAAV
jgi:ribosome-associated translation inhibitor RaiA